MVVWEHEYLHAPIVKKQRNCVSEDRISPYSSKPFNKLDDTISVDSRGFGMSTTSNMSWFFLHKMTGGTEVCVPFFEQMLSVCCTTEACDMFGCPYRETGGGA
jgi:hypothetical protein